MEQKGWTLLFHDCLARQLATLAEACDRAKNASPRDWSGNANVKLFVALSRLMLETIPEDPARAEYRQGNTLGSSYRHWRRAKIGRRFRLFFRFDTRNRIIVYAWVNDASTLRQAGAKTDPYAIFKTMLDRGTPPDTWDRLVQDSHRELP